MARTTRQEPENGHAAAARRHPPANARTARHAGRQDNRQWPQEIRGRDVRLFTRQGHDWTPKLKALATEVGSLGLPDGWLDGEIVVMGKHGETDFQALQNAFETAHADTIQYFVFDLPFYAGHDLRKVALAERRALLRRLFESNMAPRLRFSEEFEASADDMLEAACRMKLEAVIGKRADAPYVSARTGSSSSARCARNSWWATAMPTCGRSSRVRLHA